MKTVNEILDLVEFYAQAKTTLDKYKDYEELHTAIDELHKDAARFEWALPMLTGGDADKQTLALGIMLMRGLDGHAAIDAAMEST